MSDATRRAPEPAPSLHVRWNRARWPLAIALGAFCATGLYLAGSVQSLRGDVAALVASLRRVDSLRRDLQAQVGGKHPEEDPVERLADLELALAGTPAASEAAVRQLVGRLRADVAPPLAGDPDRRPAALEHVEELEAALRAETAEHSRRLGQRWNLLLAALFLSLLANLGVFVATDAYVRERERTRELRHLAATDPLTGLPNRASILRAAERELQRAAREGSACGVLLVDLDLFKEVNDRHGHHVGDEVLREVSARMQFALRLYDVVGRYGGDEFLVLVPRCDEARLRAVAARLSACVRSGIVSAGRVHGISLSIGGVCAEGDVSVDDAVRLADQALYRAKEAGRDRCVLDAAPA